MTGYLRLELLRTLRDGRYLVLAIGAPVGFYLLFAGIFGGAAPSAGELPASTEIMVSMATFGAMWGALSATAPRLARDREVGWLRTVGLTPLTAGRVLLARLLAGIVVALPALVVVGVTAVLTHDVRLAGWQWVVALVVLWVGTIPFVSLGIAVGSATRSTTAYALTTGLYFALAALGGLWVPPEVFAPTLLHVAHALPSYSLADLGWHIAAGASPPLRDVWVLLGWTVGLGLLAFAFGRPQLRPRRWGRAEVPGVAESIALTGVSKSFGEVHALDGLDLRVARGDVVALLGANGAGKSTAISVLLGLLEPDRGSARLLATRPANAVAAGRIGAMLQDTQLMAGVHVGELLTAFHRLYPHPADLDALIETAGVAELLSRGTDRLSVGEAQRVRFALAAVGDPELMVLDEPTVAMDVEGRHAFWADLRGYAAAGRTVLFSTHYLDEADQNADRIVVIRAGRTVIDGSPERVKLAAGVGRTVRFRLRTGSTEPLWALPGVTAVHETSGVVTMDTTDADATVWALYPLRDHVADLVVSEGDLQDAFLALTGAAGDRQTA